MTERKYGWRGMRKTVALAALSLGSMAAGCSEPPPEIPPRQISESPFHYPEELWDARVEGETMLEIHVSRIGSVDSAKVHTTSGHEEFDSAAVNGARELRFEPAKRGDDSVAVRVLLPVQFHMPPGEGGVMDSVDVTAPADTAAP